LRKRQSAVSSKRARVKGPAAQLVHWHPAGRISSRLSSPRIEALLLKEAFESCDYKESTQSFIYDKKAPMSQNRCKRLDCKRVHVDT
jgi:hypothetical protein